MSQYHVQLDGLVELCNQILKGILTSVQSPQEPVDAPLWNTVSIAGLLPSPVAAWPAVSPAASWDWVKESCNLLLHKLLPGSFWNEQIAQKHALAGSGNEEKTQ